MSGITTHILDTSRGVTAANVIVRLEGRDGEAWHLINETATDANGRARLLETVPHVGDYRLTFEISSYFEAQQITCFYPFVQIIFTVNDVRHHHLPLLINPFGYSTYRGS